MVKRKIVTRSKTFNTGTKKGFNAAYKFLESRPRSSSADMESYGVGKGRRIMRATVWWKERKKK